MVDVGNGWQRERASGNRYIYLNTKYKAHVRFSLSEPTMERLLSVIITFFKILLLFSPSAFEKLNYVEGTDDTEKER